MEKIAKEFLEKYSKKQDSWLQHIKINVVGEISDEDILHFGAKDAISNINKHIDFLEMQIELIKKRISNLEKEKKSLVSLITN